MDPNSKEFEVNEENVSGTFNWCYHNRIVMNRIGWCQKEPAMLKDVIALVVPYLAERGINHAGDGGVLRCTLSI